MEDVCLKRDAVPDGILRPRCSHMACLTKQRHLTSDWCRHRANSMKHACRLWFGSIPSIISKADVIHKPEVHNVSQCRQRRTEPRSQVARTENFLKFGRVYFETCERTDKHTHCHTHTHRYTDCNTSHYYRGGGEVIIKLLGRPRTAMNAEITGN